MDDIIDLNTISKEQSNVVFPLTKIETHGEIRCYHQDEDGRCYFVCEYPGCTYRVLFGPDDEHKSLDLGTMRYEGGYWLIGGHSGHSPGTSLRVGGVAVKQQEKSGKWECGFCGCQNEMTVEICEHCNGPE